MTPGGSAAAESSSMWSNERCGVSRSLVGHVLLVTDVLSRATQGPGPEVRGRRDAVDDGRGDGAADDNTIPVSGRVHLRIAAAFGGVRPAFYIAHGPRCRAASLSRDRSSRLWIHVD
jgi:hypothetical protein